MLKRKNWFMIALITIGAILFGIVSFVVIRSTRTVTAVVPATTISSGTIIQENMLTTIQVPVDTPQGYITNMGTLVGRKLRVTAEAGRFLYMSDVMTSWDDIVYGHSIPDDYVVTSISIPDERAVAGLISSGDTVDIMGVVNDTEGNTNETIREQMIANMGEAAEHSFGTDEGVQLYWVLANVTILETDSSMSEADGSLITSITGDDGGATFYVVALSYQDYLKLRLAEQYMTLWMNIAPAWNADNDPLLDVMTYAELKALADSSKQSIIEEKVNDDESVTKTISEAWLEEYKNRKEQWMNDNGYQYADSGNGGGTTDDDGSSSGGLGGTAGTGAEFDYGGTAGTNAEFDFGASVGTGLQTD